MPLPTPVRAREAALLVAHASGRHELVELMAELGFEVWVESGSDAACRRAAGGPALVLVEYEIARSEGWALLRFLSYDLSSRVPVVVFGPEVPEQHAAEVLEDLAVTYLPHSVWNGGMERVRAVLLPLLECAQRSILLLDRAGIDRSAPWARTLRTAGFDLRAAGSPVESIQAVEERRPEVLIVRDVPSVVGSDPFDGALASLCGELTVIVLADVEDRVRRQRWLAQGARAYLAGPLPDRALVEVLRGNVAADAAAPGSNTRAGESPLVQSSTQGGLLYLELDARGRISDVNLSAQRLFGVEAAGLLGRSLGPFLHPADRVLLEQPSGGRSRRRAERLHLRLSGPSELTFHYRFDCLATLDGGRALIGAPEARFQPSGGLDLVGLMSAAEESLLWLDWPSLALVAALGPISAVLGCSLEIGSALADQFSPSAGERLRQVCDSAARGEPGRLLLAEGEAGKGAKSVVVRAFPLTSGDGRSGRIELRAVALLVGPCERPQALGTSLSELLAGAQVLLFRVDPRGQFGVRGGVGPSARRGGAGGSVFEAFGDVPLLVDALRQGLAGEAQALVLELRGRTFEITLEPEIDPDGRLLCLNGAAVDASQRRHSEEQLKLVVEATSSVSGQGFFRSLVRYLTRALSVRLAYIAELTAQQPARLRMLSMWSGTEYTEGYDYEADGTPDGLVLSDGIVHLPEGLTGRFGRGTWVAQQGVTSYLGVPILDSGGQVLGVLGVMHAAPLDERVHAESILRIFSARAGVEIERQRQEQVVRGSEARWRSLVENAPDLIVTLSRDGRVQFSNRVLRSAGEGGAGDFYEQVLPEDRERLRAQVAKVFADGEATSAEFRMRRTPDRLTWHACRIGRHEELGLPSSVILVATDISPRKEAQAKLEARVQLEKLITAISTRFINLAAEELDEGIQRALQQIGEFAGLDRAFLFQFDADGSRMERTHVWSSPGLPEFRSEIREDEPGALGWLVRRVRAREDFFVRSVAGMEPSMTRERMQLESLGSRSFLCVPMSCAGDLIGFLGFDRVRGELAWDPEMPSMMRLLADVFANTLARAHSQARRAALEERLREAQKLESLGTLAGGVAHDFNNLLMAISGQAEVLLAREGLPENVQQTLAVVLKATQRGSDLTRQLLGFARSEKPTNMSVDLHAQICEATQLLGRTLNKNIHVVLELHADPAIVLGDPGKLQQVLINLAVNARDAMPNGGTLAFRTAERFLRPEDAHLYPELPSGPFIELVVEDSGSGIPDDIVERIFEPFFTTKGPGRGTGMGLAMVYGIVRSAGGTVRVHSRVGTGTAFSLFLPVVGGEKGLVEARDGEEVLTGTGTILVVDDESLVRATAAAMVAELGYKVVPLSSGASAVELVAEGRPHVDLILLDLVMPGMDGRSTFASIRKLDPTIPIVLSSGWGYDNVQHEFPEGGLAGLVRKPFQLAELSRVLRNALHGRSV